MTRTSSLPYRSQKTVASLVDIEVGAKSCGLTVESLRAWTASDHAPHYFVDGRGPLYSRSEVKQWVNENLVAVKGGTSVPKTLPILVTCDYKGTTVPPQCLAGIEGLCRVPVTSTCSGVYFLCKGGDVVYVGQSITVLARVSTHIAQGIKDFDHDRIFFLPCPPDALNKIEGGFIRELDPKYNGGYAQPYHRNEVRA